MEVQRRSSFSDWNYHAEVKALQARLGEKFDGELLMRALVMESHLEQERIKQEELGVEVTNQLRDNSELAVKGEKIIKTVFPKFDSPLSVLRAFAPEAPVEFTAFSRDVDGGLTTTHAGLTAEERVDLEASMVSTFSKWVDTLEDAGVKAAATLLYDSIVGTYDEA